MGSSPCSVSSMEIIDSESTTIFFPSGARPSDVSIDGDSIKTSSGKNAIPRITPITATPTPIKVPFFMGQHNCLFLENKQNEVISVDERINFSKSKLFRPHSN